MKAAQALGRFAVAEVENKGATKSRGVLLVCQSDNTMGALAAILNQNNETALTAQTPREAWDCVRAGGVGCVVLDLTSPPLDALTIFRTTRSSQSTCRVPFLFLIKKDHKIAKLDLAGPDLVRDSWLVLPCSSVLFLTAVRALLDSKLRDTQILQPLREPAPNAEAGAHPEWLLAGGPGMFSGKIGLLDVTKILGMVEPLRLTGMLRVADGKRMGNVHFVEGAVRHAELNDIEGPDALFLLFHLKAGVFRFDMGPPASKQTIEGNTMTLLLEGLRQMDEAKALVRAFQEKRANHAGGTAQT